MISVSLQKRRNTCRLNYAAIYYWKRITDGDFGTFYQFYSIEHECLRRVKQDSLFQRVRMREKDSCNVPILTFNIINSKMIWEYFECTFKNRHSSFSTFLKQKIIHNAIGRYERYDLRNSRRASKRSKYTLKEKEKTRRIFSPHFIFLARGSGT